jgi:uncharacterized secreted protein with C-terminal beta-propeller domain
MLARRFPLFLASLFVSLAAAATTVEQRSPFTQGHWWDPTRSGHGFELLNAAGQVFAVWYTYDEAGAPTWYTIQGDQELMGNPWPLMRHEWSGGRISRSTVVGQAMLRRQHTEKIDFIFELNGRSGQWAIEPFRQSGVINEVDLTGHWYDPGQDGWGLSVVDQGDVFGAVIYAYDPAGAPTWVAGFDRGKGTLVNLYSTRGTCPTCAYRPVATAPAGSIRIDYRGDTEITLRGTPSVAFAPGVTIDSTRAKQLGRPMSMRRVDFQIAPFAAEKTLKDFLVAGMSNRRFASSGADFSAAPPPSGPPSFSLTNTQEAGVDEADVVKTDGRHIYSMIPISYTGSTTGGYTQKVRIVDAGPAGSLLQPVGEFSIYRDPSAYYADSGLYLHAGNLTTIASVYYYGGWYTSPPEAVQTLVDVRDLANPAAPASRWRARISGALVSSRRIGDRLYLVTRFTPHVPGYYSYAWNEQQRAQNAAVLAAAPLEALLPRASVNEAPSAALVGPASVHAPPLGGNVAVADMVVVTVIDLREPRVVDSLAIVGRTEAMYVSNSNLYLASTRYNFTDLLPAPGGNLYNTDVHQVRIGGERLQYVGSGSIEGLVGWGDKASFRFGEHNGRLAVVSSLMGWWGANSNRVTILEPSAAAPGLLRTVSFLPNASRPQPLGKPNERVYGTRFVGDKLYAVTFRQVDPLYIVDLSNKADPRITGELELPGFSDYLHPLPNGLLLGFGRDATAEGFFQGMQMSLFDVTGAAPRLVDQVQIGKRGSDSPLFRSHHAFSALPKADGSTVVAFPAAVHDGAPPAQNWAYFPYQYSGLLRYEVRGSTAQSARLVALPSLVTDRGNGIDQYNYQNAYDERGWGQGRSVLFQDSSYYMGNGKFWRLQNATGEALGPY